MAPPNSPHIRPVPAQKRTPAKPEPLPPDVALTRLLSGVQPPVKLATDADESETENGEFFDNLPI